MNSSNQDFCHWKMINTDSIAFQIKYKEPNLNSDLSKTKFQKFYSAKSHLNIHKKQLHSEL